MKLHILHAVAVCISLAQQPSRTVSYEVLPTLAPGQDVSVVDRYDFAPYVAIESPLYRAIIDRDRRSCVWIQYTVRREDVAEGEDVDRGWWNHRELMPHCLESEDYNRSGLDRGHLRSLLMSRGSRHWSDINNMAVIVPQDPTLNRGELAQFENDICQLAMQYGWCRVTITLTFDDDVRTMPYADEEMDICDSLIYRVESPAGEVTETFRNGGE